jgi:hypothetical protein
MTTLWNFFDNMSNAVSFFISLLSIFSISYYYVTEDVYYVMVTIYAVFIQFSLDILLWRSNASVIHHLCVITFTYTLFTVHSDLDVSEYIYIILPILSTEISTLFLVIKIWMEQFDLKQSPWYFVNLIVFFVTFVITRICIYTTYVILNPRTYELQLSTVIYIGVYVLFALNIYWVTIMIRVMLRPLKHIPATVYTELFIKYGQVVNVGIVLWFNSNLSLNFIGASLVTVTSFSTYSLMCSSDVFKNSLFLFLTEVALQVKSLLFVFSYLGTMFGHLSLLCHFFFFTFSLFILIQRNSQFYFHGKTLAVVLLGVFSVEYFSDYYILSNNIFGFLLSLTLIFYTYPIFYLTENEAMLIPVIMDIAAVIYYIPTLEMKIFFGVLSYIMGVVIYVKPMHNYNMALLYVLSFAQTYALCKINY